MAKSPVAVGVVAPRLPKATAPPQFRTSVVSFAVRVTAGAVIATGVVLLLVSVELDSLPSSLLTTTLPAPETPKVLIWGIHLLVELSLVGSWLCELVLIAPATAIVNRSPVFVAVACKPEGSVRLSPLASRRFLVLRWRSLRIRESPIPMELLNWTAPEKSA